jgi:hypothetical protein
MQRNVKTQSLRECSLIFGVNKGDVEMGGDKAIILSPYPHISLVTLQVSYSDLKNIQN